MARLLSGVRKYKLGLILAHQDMRQLHDVPEVESAVLTNAGTRVCFRLGDVDAKILAEGFSTFEADDLRDLGVGEALVRVDRAEQDFNLATEPMDEVNEVDATCRKNAILALSRDQYATSRVQIENMLSELMPVPPSAPPVSPPVQAPKQVPTTRPPAPVAPSSPVPSPTRIPIPIPVVPPPPIPSPKPESPVLAPLGKGGPEHRRLQEIVAGWARGLGYRATIEQPTPDGGSVDVVIEHGARRIACEISVTSTVEQELGNLRKCLAAGFTEIFMICVARRTQTGLEKAARKEYPEDTLNRVQFLSPEVVLETPDLLRPTDVSGQTVGGYKVTTRMRVPDGIDSQVRRETIARVLLKSVRGKSSK
jgi:hypothetical protein